MFGRNKFQPTFSDEEMAQLLNEQRKEDARGMPIPQIDIDRRTDRFWNVYRNWRPKMIREGRPYPISIGRDHIFGRYAIINGGEGTDTEDYWVSDSEDRSFSVPLSRFLDMYDKGMIPQPMKQKRKHIWG